MNPLIERFAKLVKLMRAAQSRYFEGDRRNATINMSIDLERRVDRGVRWVSDHREDVDLVDLVELAEKVKAMRAAQARYFEGDKSEATRRLSIHLERWVDRAIKRELDHDQLKLFPPESEGAYRRARQ